MDVFDLTAILKLDSSQYERGLSDAEKESGSFGSKFTSAMGTAAKVGAAALGAAATAVGVMTKAAISGFGEQQQLVGGVQKLYGNMGMSLEEYAASTGQSIDQAKGKWQELENAQNLVLENAKQAYKTAGMSANEYMDTATSFSAALINSLGGDTVKAAEQTDVAMRAISDNFNTFGGDIGMIQGAFQGFAKQNYTMLDNLKLGYGGTKEEMERLIADANEYGKSIGMAGDLSIDSFSDIVTAIDLVQQKQGIAGTTAREAASTVQGSLNMLKGAWDNLLAGLGDKNADLGKLMQDVVDSAEIALGNLLPVVETALSGISDLIGKIGPIIAKKLPETISKVLPKLITAGMNILLALVQGITDNLPTLIEAGIQTITSLIAGITEALPELINSIVSAIPQIVTALQENLPVLLGAVRDLILTVMNSILENYPMYLESVTQFFQMLIQFVVDSIPMLIEMINTIVNTLVEYIPVILPLMIEAGIQLFTALVGALPQIIEQILAVLPIIIDAIVQLIPAILPPLVEAGITLFTALVQALPEIIEAIVNAIPAIIDSVITAIIDSIPLLIDAGVELFIALVENLPLIIETIISALPHIISAVVNTLAQNIPKIIEAGVKLFVALVKNMPRIIVEIVKSIPQLIRSIVGAVGEGVTLMAEAGANLIKGLWNGIKGVGGWLWDKVSGLLGDLWDGILDFFGIASPSKEMAWVGEMISKGLAGGITDSAKQAIDAATELSESLMDTLTSDYNISPNVNYAQGGYSSDGLYGSSTNFGGITINVYGSDNMNVNDLAEEVERRLVQLERQRANAWA